MEKKIKWRTDFKTICIEGIAKENPTGIPKPDEDFAAGNRPAEFKKGEITTVEMMDQLDDYRLFYDKTRNCIFRVESDAKAYDFVE